MDKNEIDELIEKLHHERMHLSRKCLELDEQNCVESGLSDAISGLNRLKEAQEFTANAIAYAKLYDDPQNCPFCDSDNITHKYADGVKDSIFSEQGECDECGRKWEVWYTIYSVNEIKNG